MGEICATWNLIPQLLFSGKSNGISNFNGYFSKRSVTKNLKNTIIKLASLVSRTCMGITGVQFLVSSINSPKHRVLIGQLCFCSCLTLQRILLGVYITRNFRQKGRVFSLYSLLKIVLYKIPFKIYAKLYGLP